MKNTSILLIVLLSFIAFSCNQSIIGEGKIVTQDSLFSQSYENVVLRGNYMVVFEKSTKSAIKIEANENLISNIEFKINGKDLWVSEKSNVEKNEIYKITISTPNFNEISINGNIQAETLGLINQEEIKINIEDNATFMATLALSKLRLNLSQNAKSNLNGSTSEAEITLSDNAELIAPNFSISDADFSLSENATAKIMVLKSLNGEGNGNSVLEYKGEPNKDFNTKENAVIKSY